MAVGLGTPKVGLGRDPRGRSTAVSLGTLKVGLGPSSETPKVGLKKRKEEVHDGIHQEESQ